MTDLTRVIFNEIGNALNDGSKVDFIMSHIKENEPEMYTFIQESVGMYTNQVGDHAMMTLKDANVVGHFILRAFLFGYIYYKIILQKKVDGIIRANDFNAWIDGKLSAGHYKYSMNKMSRESTLYQAKKNFLKREEEKNMLRKLFLEVGKFQKDIISEEELKKYNV